MVAAAPASRAETIAGVLKLVHHVAGYFARRYDLDADDLAQATFLKLLVKFDRFDPAARSVGWFVWRCAGIAARQQFRDRQRAARAVGFDPDVLAEFAVDDFNPTAAVDAAEEAERVRRAVGELPARERRVLELRFGLDGGRRRPLAEVGGEIGQTAETARKVERAGLARLAEAMG